MKLRINQQSIRFRLSEKEVEILQSNGALSEIVVLGLKEDDCFFYHINAYDENEIRVIYSISDLSIMVPKSIIHHWASYASEVGFEANVEVYSGSLHVLVEKDFECLHKDANS